MADDVKKIAQRIELTGEKEYSAALKEAQRNLKVLRSELKAESAELGKNATEQQKNETRLKNLQKQIKEQEKIVRTYEKALEEVRAKYGDNEEAIAKWEIKLNDARTALANMKNSLTDVGQGMKSVQDSANLGVVAANSLADSLGNVADVGSSISDSIEGAFNSVVSTIAGAISELWAQLMDVSARANNWTDIATTWNTTAGNIQKWYHAVQAEGKDFAKLSNFVAKIVTADNKKVTESTKVSAANYADQWEYAMAVMDSLAGMDNLNDQMAALSGMGISGAKQEGWLDMLKAWKDIQENGDKFDTSAGGMGLTDEELEKANELAIVVAKLQESWQALKDHAMVNLFGDLALNITGNIQNVLDAFHEYFNAEDDDARAAALAKVKENILEAFRNVMAAIQEGIEMLSGLAEDLKNSDDELAQALGNALEALVNALKWLADSSHWETIKTGLEWLIGIWAAGKIGGALMNLATFAGHIATIKSSGGLFGSLFGNSGNKATPSGDGTTLVPTATSKETTATTAGGLFDRFVQGAGAKVVLDEAEALMNQAKQNTDKLEQLTEENNWDDTERNYWMLTGKAPDKNSKEYQEWEKAFNEIGTSAGRSFGEETSEDKPFGVLTHEQTAAVEAMFDAWRNHRVTMGSDESEEEFDTAWDNLEKIFGENTDAFNDLIDTMEEVINDLEFEDKLDQTEDLPADWWNKNSLTSEDIMGFRTLPGQMSAAVARGVSGIKVNLDGQTVGNLVAPYVSQQIASSIFG